MKNHFLKGKKLVFVMLSTAMLCSLTAVTVMADEIAPEENTAEETVSIENGEEVCDSTEETSPLSDFTITLDSDGTANITKYLGSDSVVVIPEIITKDGIEYKIDTINTDVFLNNLVLKKVVLSKNIKYLGNRVFKNCKNLSEVVIKGDLSDASYRSNSPNYNDYDYSVFYAAGQDVDGGITVTFEEGVERIPAYLFATTRGTLSVEYAKVGKVIISKTVKTVGSDAFINCHALKEIDFGTETNPGTIGDSAFAGCNKLEEVKFNDKCTVGTFAFGDCLSLSRFETMGGTLGDKALKNCKNLTEVIIKGNLSDASSKIPFSGYRDDYYSVFYGAGQDVENGMTVNFAEGAEFVPAYLFATRQGELSDSYAKVGKVIISNTVKTVGSYAFYNCHALSEIDFGTGSSLTSIGSDAFKNDNNLNNVKLPASLIAVNEQAFAYNTNLSEISFDEALTTIGKSAFAFSGLEKVSFPAALSSIGNYSFECCNTLKEVKFNGNCSIGEGAFINCVELNRFEMAGGSLGEIALKNCKKLSEIVINGNLSDASSYSTGSSDGNTSVFYAAGKDVENGMTVTFGSGVKVIPAYILATGRGELSYDYAKVGTVYIPASVTTMGKYSFYNCHGLKDIYYEGTMEEFSGLNSAAKNDFSKVNIHCSTSGSKPVPTSEPTNTPNVKPTQIPGKPTQTPDNKPVEGNQILSPTDVPEVNKNDIVAVGGKKTVLSGETLKVKLDGVSANVIKVKGKGVTYDPATGIVKTSGKGTATLYYLNGKKKVIIAKIKIEQPKLKKELKLCVGKSKKLKLSGTKSKVEYWDVINPNVATVDSSGLVAAMGTGTTVVRAHIGSNVYTCTVNVSSAKTKVKK